VTRQALLRVFYTFAREAQKREAEALIAAEELDIKAAKRYITASIKHEFASDDGDDLNNILPEMNPFDPDYLTRKQTIFQKIIEFVEKFKGVGGKI